MQQEQTIQTKLPQSLPLNAGLGELHALEIELIRRIRFQYRFGELVITLHEGLPRKIKSVTVYDDLRDELDKK